MLKYYNFDIVFSEIPDEVTLAINLTQCPNHCEGCHSPWLQEDKGKVVDENEIEALLSEYDKLITCFCFIGGDAAPLEVERMAQYIKTTNHLKTAWYSGKSELSKEIAVTSFDYIKVGPYNKAFGPLTSRTTNQRLYKVTPDGDLEDITKRFWKASDIF